MQREFQPVNWDNWFYILQNFLSWNKGFFLCNLTRSECLIGKSLVRFQMVSLEFFIDIKSFRSHYGPGIDTASNRNEYQEYFLRVKTGRCVRLATLPPSCDVTKSGNFNFLEPSGPLQACNGTDLPFKLFRWNWLKWIGTDRNLHACLRSDKHSNV